MNRIFLVRHGENLANLTKEFSCRKIDYSLTAKGIVQCEQTADYFVDKRIAALYSSPLRRAVETAEIIGQRLNLPFDVLEEFREHDVGDLEGMADLASAWSIASRVWTAWLSGDADARCPGGEDLNTMRARFRAGLERVVAGRDGQNLIVVGHGGIFTAPLTDICPEVDIIPLLISSPNHNCSISEIHLEHRNGRLLGTLAHWAETGHLHGPAAELVPGWLATE